jgi:hypothetical protein
MSRSILSRTILAATGLVAAATPVLTTAAMAQGAPPVPQDYYQQQQQPNGPRGDYRNLTPPDDQRAPDRPDGDYRNQYQPGEPQAPAGYDGRDLPPPPAGYAPPDNREWQRAADARYAAEAQRWSRDNCVKSRGDAGTGAVVGGILGAIIGSGLSGRHDHGTGVVAGAAIGAVGGAAIGSASGGDTSPGCPPGYVVRRGASSYSYAPSGYYYAAPDWYRPWVFVDGIWVYRPYPYHDWYYRNYRGPRGGYDRGGYDRGGRGPGEHDGRDHGGGDHRH